MSENKFDLMRNAIAEARNTMNAADRSADTMARILDGRLRHVDPWVLKRLKKELASFNAHTGEWK